MPDFVHYFVGLVVATNEASVERTSTLLVGANDEPDTFVKLTDTIKRPADETSSDEDGDDTTKDPVTAKKLFLVQKDWGFVVKLRLDPKSDQSLEYLKRLFLHTFPRLQINYIYQRTTTPPRDTLGKIFVVDLGVEPVNRLLDFSLDSIQDVQSTLLEIPRDMLKRVTVYVQKQDGCPLLLVRMLNSSNITDAAVAATHFIGPGYISDTTVSATTSSSDSDTE